LFPRKADSSSAILLTLHERNFGGQEQLIANGVRAKKFPNYRFYFCWPQLSGERSEELTFEEVVLQAPGAHELVHQHPVLVLIAVPDQFHQVLMPQLPEKENLGLQE
jgi:hypothetical protein